MARIARRPPPKLAQQVELVKASRSTAIEGLESTAAGLEGLHHPADAPCTVPHVGMEASRSILACPGRDPPRHRGRNGRADEVDGAADGVGPVGNLAGALHHLDAVHPAHAGEIVGTGGRVGSRRNRHAILENGNAAAPLRATASQPDVGPQAEAVLLLDVHAGHASQGAAHVHIAMPLQRFGRQHGHRSGNAHGPTCSQAYRLDQRLGQIQHGFLQPDVLSGQQHVSSEGALDKSETAQGPLPRNGFHALQNGQSRGVRDDPLSVRGEEGHTGNSAAIGVYNAHLHLGGCASAEEEKNKKKEVIWTHSK